MDPEYYLREAKKLEAPQSKFTSWLGGGNSSRLEDAAENYIRAANAYRVQKDSLSAGQTFEKAAACQEKSEARDDASNTYVEAYKCYKLVEPRDAARVLSKAIGQFTARGQFRRAANYQMDLGDLHEELEQPSEAIEAYKTAGDWYLQDQAASLSNKAYLKVAEQAGLFGDYATAIENFDQVAKQSLKDNLTRWGVKDHFLRAGLCRLAREDTVDAERCIDEYVSLDPGFGQTRECQLLHNLTQAVKEGDVEEFSTKAAEYDQFSKLDKWKTTIMLRIKEKVTGAEDDLL